MATGATGEQRKLVTVLFADLVDFTVVSHGLDPEDVRDVMNRYFAVWRRAIEDEGGTVEKFIGDAVMAVFGLERGHEDDPHRAARAALSMRRRLEELNDDIRAEYGVELSMRTGIDTGEVVVSTLGERGDDDFVVVGEPVNRAARLQAASPPGGILLSPDTCRHVRGAFALQRLADLHLKGFDAPIDGFLVLEDGRHDFWPETRGIEGITTRTVGRELELGRLEKLFADVIDEDCWTITTVIGDAGIGKTRLLHDFESWIAQRPDGVWVLRGRAATSTTNVPHGLMRSAFADRLDIHDSDEPGAVRAKFHAGVAPLLGDGIEATRAADVVATWLGFALDDAPEASALTRDPEALSRRARQLVIELFRQLSDRAPVVVLLEDLHWADNATLDWLEQLGVTTPGYPLLVVATSRPDLLDTRPHWGEGLDGHVTLRLDKLSRREGRELVAEILQKVERVPDGLRDRLVDEADGNPFYLEELVKWLIDERVVDPADGWTVHEDLLDTVQLPTTLRGLLQARLDALQPGDRDVLERAAVVGKVFWDGAVADLADDDGPDHDLGDSLGRLRAREVVFQRPTTQFEGMREYSFRHALMCDVTYASLLRPRRRRLHARAATWLRDATTRSRRPDEQAAIIAEHLEQAGDGAEAAAWYLRSAGLAASSFANDNALHQLERAERLAPSGDDPLLFDVLAQREQVLDRLGRREQQRATLDRLAGMTGVDAARRATHRLAEARWRFFHSEFDAIVPLAEEAAQLARQAGRVDLELDARVWSGRSRAYIGQQQEARDHLEGLLADAGAAGSRRHEAASLHLLGVVATNLGDHDTGVDVLRRGAELFHELGDVEGEGLVVGQLGALLISMGRLDEGRRETQRGLEMFAATGHLLRQAISLGNLCQVALDLGEFDVAMAHATRVLELSEPAEDFEGQAGAHLALAEIHALTGDAIRARHHLDRAVALAGERNQHYYLAFVLAQVAVRDLAEGRVEAARASADRAREHARRSDVTRAVARTTLVAGLTRAAVGDHEQAAGLLREAAEQLARLGGDAEEVEARGAMAASLAAAGHHDEATAAARTVATALQAGTRPGVMEPGRPLLQAHEVLAAAGDPLASELAGMAGRFLAQRRDLLQEDTMRAGFLSTPVAVELAALAATSAATTSTSHPADETGQA